MASDKPDKPASFLTLARELRQKILLQTYDVTKYTQRGFPLNPRVASKTSNMTGTTDWDKWRCRDHKERIEKWCSVLRAIDAAPSFNQDIQYVEKKWKEELEDERLRRETKAKDSWRADRGWIYVERLWESTREGEAPWTRLHGALCEFNQFRRSSRDPHEIWSKFMANRSGGAEPWIAPRVSFNACGFRTWGAGPSGVQWDEGGNTHPPPTWDDLAQAADTDIDWIKQELERYQKALPERYHTKVFRRQ